jgi:hypothetical protein
LGRAPQVICGRTAWWLKEKIDFQSAVAPAMHQRAATSGNAGIFVGSSRREKLYLFSMLRKRLRTSAIGSFGGLLGISGVMRRSG